MYFSFYLSAFTSTRVYTKVFLQYLLCEVCMLARSVSTAGSAGPFSALCCVHEGQQREPPSASLLIVGGSQRSRIKWRETQSRSLFAADTLTQWGVINAINQAPAPVPRPRCSAITPVGFLAETSECGPRRIPASGPDIRISAHGVTCLFICFSSAWDRRSGSQVAIKKLHRPFQSKLFAKRAYRELRLLKHMKHENVRNAPRRRRDKEGFEGIQSLRGAVLKGARGTDVQTFAKTT